MILLLWSGITCLLFVIVANLLVSSNARGKTFDEIQDVPHNRVGLLLGTSREGRSGNLNAYYSFRIDAAFELFEAGKIKYILISGDNGTREYDEPTMMKNDLVARGVPASRIYLDYAGFRTFDSMERALKVFGQKQFTVISQKFHNERAIYLAESFGIEAIGYNAKDVKKNAGFRTRLREYFARAKVFIDLWTGKKSKFLGEPVKIG
jgi:SanA protein